MTPNQISFNRLYNQQVFQPEFKDPKALLSWMGAMQAQDYNMVKWALGVRLQFSTDEQVEEALNNGDILRTHLLRPTWHLVSADDIYWMLELTAPQIKTSLNSRHKQLELTNGIFRKSQEIMMKALAGGNHLTRNELMKLMEEEGINTSQNRSAHLMMCAELDGIVCSGVSKGNDRTFALLEERVPEKKLLSREESLARLAGTYFRSHGPATIADFTWWSGLNKSDARIALEMNRQGLDSFTLDEHTYWFMENGYRADKKPSIHVLPAYDEFIISYKNRSATLTFQDHKKAVSNNGVFRPIIVINGEVTGIWKRTVKKNVVQIEASYFKQIDAQSKEAIEQKFEGFGAFLGKKISIHH